MRWKRIRKSRGALAALLLFVLISTQIPALAAAQAPASEQAIAALGYIVVNTATGGTVLEKNADTRYYPASTTKILTALMVLEKVPSWDEMLTFSEWAVHSTPWDSSTLKPEAEPGEVMSVRDALYGMMLASANECASALVEHAYGSLDEYLKAAQLKLNRLGCDGTHFVNAHGYHDDDHYTTPRDLARIFAAALENERFLQIDSTHVYTMAATNVCGERTVGMGHQMIGGVYDFPYAVAGKTGYTPEAGRTLATYAVKDGIPLICIIMSSTNEQFYYDTDKLLTEAFAIEERRMAMEIEEKGGEGLIVPEGTLPAYVLPEGKTDTMVIAPPELSGGTSRLFRGVLFLTGAAFISAGALFVFIVITGVRMLLGRRRRHES